MRGVSFALEQGDLLGIVGESGSGKSVTAHSLLRLLPANAHWSGELRYDGRSIAALSDGGLRQLRGGEIAIIFQEPGLCFDPIYSIGRAMSESIRSRHPRLTAGEVRERSIHLLEEVNVPSPADRLTNYPHQLSGGLLQRIMIALALSSDPKVLIADEPTTALDVTIQAGIIDLLLRLRRDHDLSIIFITHNLGLIASIADYIAVMYAGLILELGPTAELVQRPRHPYTRALLESIPRFGHHHSTDHLATIPGVTPNPLHSEPGCPFAPRCPLVGPDCREALPELHFDTTHYRCIRPGPKTELLDA